MSAPTDLPLYRPFIVVGSADGGKYSDICKLSPTWYRLSFLRNSKVLTPSHRDWNDSGQHLSVWRFPVLVTILECLRNRCGHTLDGHLSKCLYVYPWLSYREPWPS